MTSRKGRRQDPFGDDRRKLTMRRLPRLDIANPSAVASAHRRAKGSSGAPLPCNDMWTEPRFFVIESHESLRAQRPDSGRLQSSMLSLIRRDEFGRPHRMDGWATRANGQLTFSGVRINSSRRFDISAAGGPSRRPLPVGHSWKGGRSISPTQLAHSPTRANRRKSGSPEHGEVTQASSGSLATTGHTCPNSFTAEGSQLRISGSTAKRARQDDETFHSPQALSR